MKKVCVPTPKTLNIYLKKKTKKKHVLMLEQKDKSPKVGNNVRLFWTYLPKRVFTFVYFLQIIWPWNKGYH